MKALMRFGMLTTCVLGALLTGCAPAGGGDKKELVFYASALPAGLKLFKKEREDFESALSELDEEQLFALCASCEPLLRRRVVRWAAEDRDRRMPVSGRDLVNAELEGPVVGAALSRIRAAFLDGEVANREEAMALAREIQRTATARKTRRKKRPPASSKKARSRT